MDKILNQIKKITSNNKNINKIILFGSRARGDNSNKSDYDIAVFSKNMDISEQSMFLEDIDNIDTLNKIDVVFIKGNHLNTDLYKNIMKDGIVIMDKFQIKLNNYKAALARLHEATEESKSSNSLTVRDGVIQRFEFTTELAWKTTREYLIIQEVNDINTPKNVMKAAFAADVITNAEGWLTILRDRNLTSHIYDENDANEIFNRITTQHIILFDELSDTLSKINN